MEKALFRVIFSYQFIDNLANIKEYHMIKKNSIIILVKFHHIVPKV